MSGFVRAVRRRVLDRRGRDQRLHRPVRVRPGRARPAPASLPARSLPGGRRGRAGSQGDALAGAERDDLAARLGGQRFDVWVLDDAP